MSIHFTLPTPADFDLLSKAQDIAVTVYVETAPTVADAERAKVAFKSAFDDALMVRRARSTSILTPHKA